MAKCLWQAPANRPSGDLLSYVQMMGQKGKESFAKGKGKGSGYTGMKEE